MILLISGDGHRWVSFRKWYAGYQGLRPSLYNGQEYQTSGPERSYVGTDSRLMERFAKSVPEAPLGWPSLGWSYVIETRDEELAMFLIMKFSAKKISPYMGIGDSTR